MLLQHIVEKLDEELVRLRHLREIVAGLGRLPAAVMTDETTAQLVLPALREGDEAQRRPLRRGFRRGTRAAGPRNVKAKLQTALTSAIPAGPVVVSAAMLAEESAAREQARAAVPKVEEGTLGAMIRALRQQGAV